MRLARSSSSPPSREPPADVLDTDTTAASRRRTCLAHRDADRAAALRRRHRCGRPKRGAERADEVGRLCDGHPDRLLSDAAAEALGTP